MNDEGVTKSGGDNIDMSSEKGLLAWDKNLMSDFECKDSVHDMYRPVRPVRDFAETCVAID